MIAPVRRQPHYQPVYYLVFLTADRHSLWVFNDAASKAREDWLRALGPDQDLETEYLFPDDTVDDLIEMEERRATAINTRNLLELVSTAATSRSSTTSRASMARRAARPATRRSARRCAPLVRSGDIEFVFKASRQMVNRYASATRAERAREAHRRLSPMDRL